MKNSKQKTIIIFVGVILLNLLISSVYVYSFYAVKTKNEEASLISLELKEYLSKEGAINLLKKSVKNTESERKNIDASFVARDDVPVFAKKIESLGGMSGTKLSITKLQAQGNVLSIGLSSEGSFRNTLHLISLIETLPFKVEITKAYINTIERLSTEEVSESGRGVWNGKFNIKLTGFVAK